MIFRVSFTREIDGKQTVVTGNVNGTFVLLNDIHQGLIEYKGGKWTSLHAKLTPHAEAIAKNFGLVKEKFKWRLPKHVKDLMLWAKYDFDKNFLIIAIDDSSTFEDFEQAVREHFIKAGIKNDAKILLTCPKRLTEYLPKLI